MTTNMPHIHSNGTFGCGVARWLLGRRRNNLSLSQQVEVEARRAEYTSIAQSPAGARTLSSVARAFAHRHADVRPCGPAAHANRCQALLAGGPKDCPTEQDGQASATPHFGHELRRSAHGARS